MPSSASGSPNPTGKSPTGKSPTTTRAGLHESLEPPLSPFGESAVARVEEQWAKKQQQFETTKRGMEVLLTHYWVRLTGRSR